LLAVVVAACQWRPILRGYLHYRISRVTSSLPHCDRIEVFHLDGSGIRDATPVDASAGFPIHPYGSFLRILGRTTLSGSDAADFAALWRAQEFGWEYQALCHNAAYGLRYYSGSSLIFETSICYHCSNFYYTALGSSGWWGFDTETPKAQALLTRFQQIFPESAPKPK
jgi:hypothetical protein